MRALPILKALSQSVLTQSSTAMVLTAGVDRTLRNLFYFFKILCNFIIREFESLCSTPLFRGQLRHVWTVWQVGASVCEVVHRWSHASVTIPPAIFSHTKMFLFFPETDYQINNDKLILCLPVDLGFFLLLLSLINFTMSSAVPLLQNSEGPKHIITSLI